MHSSSTAVFLLLCVRLWAQPFQPNGLGHVTDPAFPGFLTANGILLCVSFSVTHSLDSTIYFAVIFKEYKMMFLESTGKIYSTYVEYVKATGIQEFIDKGFE